jgi:hypothetical protein
MKNKNLEKLKKFVGLYQGQGTNHEGNPFVGHFELSEILQGSGLQIKFEAKSIDSKAIFHSEVSTLAPTPSGVLALFNLNSNTPFMCEHPLVAEDSDDHRLSLKFRFGKIEDHSSFREEINLNAIHKTITYQYSWGLPGGPFSERSKVTLFLDADQL